MIVHNLSDLPYIVLLRSDVLLFHLLHLGVYQKEKFDTSPLLFSGIRTLSANTLRKDDIEHIITNIVPGKFSADYDLGFLSKCFQRFFVYDGKKRVVCNDNMSPELSSLSRYTHPHFVICYDVARRYVDGRLSVDDVVTLSRNTSPLGANVSYRKAFADNHVHLGGCYEPPTSLIDIACRFKVPSAFYGEDSFSKLPHSSALSYCTSGRFTLGILIHLYREIHSLLTDFAVSGSSALVPHVSQVRKILQSEAQALTSHSQTSIDFFGKIQPLTPSEPHHHLLGKTIDAYKAGDDEQAFFLYISTIYCIYLKHPGNKVIHRFIKCFIHLANILRAYMVMSEGVGLGSFKEYYGSPLRRTRNSHKTVARSVVMSGTTHVEGRINPERVTKECSLYLKSFRWAEGERKALYGGKKDVNLKFCIHMIRGNFKDPLSSSFTCRYSKARKLAREKAIELDDELRSARLDLSDSIKVKLSSYRNIPLVNFITGFDVAGDESLVPIEVYAPALRFLRRDFTPRPMLKRTFPHYKNVYRFKLCIHAGEDFSHLLSGIRKIDETLLFCGMRAGDRIGHAVALGIDPAAWISIIREGFCSKCEFLDNLVWAVHQAANSRHLRAKWNNVISRYNETIACYSKDIYGAEYSASTLYSSWLLRRNCPESASLKARILGGADDYLSHATPDYGVLQGPSQEAHELFKKYYYDFNAYTNGEKKILFRFRKGDRKADYVIDDEEVKFLKALQEHMLKRLTQRKVAIECNVSSNTFISTFDGFGEHPVLTWSPPSSVIGDNKTGAVFHNLCICSDDPSIFCTSLQNEFHLLREAAMRKNHEASDIEKWLERLRMKGLHIFKAST